jgi:hypothetical protein
MWLMLLCGGVQGQELRDASKQQPTRKKAEIVFSLNFSLVFSIGISGDTRAGKNGNTRGQAECARDRNTCHTSG